MNNIAEYKLDITLVDEAWACKFVPSSIVFSCDDGAADFVEVGVSVGGASIINEDEPATLDMPAVGGMSIGDPVGGVLLDPSIINGLEAGTCL